MGTWHQLGRDNGLPVGKETLEVPMMYGNELWRELEINVEKR